MVEKKNTLLKEEEFPWDELIPSVNDMKNKLVLYQQYQLYKGRMVRINGDSTVHNLGIDKLITDKGDEMQTLKWFYPGNDPDVLLVTEHEKLGDVLKNELTNKTTSFSLAWRNGKKIMLSRFTVLG